jgi:hypothetical protein
MKSKLALLAVLAIATGALAGCSSTTSEAGCVQVVIDYGILSEKKFDECLPISADGAIAKEFFSASGISTEGTLTYGDQIVCRVNNLPAADQAFEVLGEDPHTETCADMPPAFAYWALWIKSDSDSQWAYAEEGIGTLKLSPGQSIGLVFSTNGETPTPN